MAVAHNMSNSEIPSAVIIGTVNIGDILTCDVGETITTHMNKASMRKWGYKGGTSLITPTLTLSTLDQKAATLTLGNYSVLGIEYPGIGLSSLALGYSLATDAVLKLKSKQSSGSDGKRQYTLGFELFSADGTTHPLVKTLATAALSYPTVLHNRINKEIPDSITINTSTTFGDIKSAEWGEELEIHPNTASMRVYAMDGGDSAITQTLSVTTLDQSAATIGLVALTQLEIIFPTVGDSTTTQKLALASGATGHITGNTGGASEGLRQHTLTFEFYANATASPQVAPLAISLV